MSAIDCNTLLLRRPVRIDSIDVTVQVSRSPTFQALSGASAPAPGPRIVPKYLTRSWEDLSRPWKCLGSRRLCRGERLPIDADKSQYQGR